MKVYRQQEIQDGGLKKGNALSLTVILEVTYCIHQISSYALHRNIIPSTMSMFVRSVSRLPLISTPHGRKKPEIDIMTAKLEDYFILGRIATIRYISTTISMFAEKCQALYTPSPFVCIDETLVGFRGRCLFHAYIPSKPDRYGLKIWSMCNVSSSDLYNLQVYLGKEGDRVGEQQQGARVVSDLATLIYVFGRNITTDSFFTSHSLAKFLLGLNLALLGTVRKKRKQLPSQLVLKKRIAFESVFAFTEDTTSRTPQIQTRPL